MATKPIDYYALSDAEKRVEIAKDVIRQIAAGNIEPVKGTYFANRRERWGVQNVTNVTKLIDYAPVDYYALTDAEKRVAIARDVIVRLEAGAILAGFVYFSADPLDVFENCPALEKGDLRKSFRRRTQPCEVCAIGGLFYSQVMLGNGVQLSSSRDGLSDDELRRKLLQVFSSEQLQLIELAYEGRVTWTVEANLLSPSQQTRCGDFCYAHRSEDGGRRMRMRAIAENIIANGGEFVP